MIISRRLASLRTQNLRTSVWRVSALQAMYTLENRLHWISLTPSTRVRTASEDSTTHPPESL